MQPFRSPFLQLRKWLPCASLQLVSSNSEVCIRFLDVGVMGNEQSLEQSRKWMAFLIEALKGELEFPHRDSDLTTKVKENSLPKVYKGLTSNNVFVKL